MAEANGQHVPGLTSSCCGGLTWALSCGYIRKGYLWRKLDHITWIPWSLYIKGKGFCDQSPIHFCPFCGRDLDDPEE